MLGFYILFVMINFIFTEQKSLCIDGENFCKKCNIATNLCISCQKDIFIPDENGGCIGAKKCTVGKNYCEECDSDKSLCEICSIGYYPDENGGCAYTDNCEFSYHGECLNCKDNFLLINRLKICKSLSSNDFKNCENIDYSSGFCSTCKKGYYLNNGDKKCNEIEHCFESLYDQCILCAPGYYLDFSDERKCKPSNSNNNISFYCKETEDGETCIKCEDGYYLDDYNKCSYINYCSKSKPDSRGCFECKKDYYLSKDTLSCTLDEGCSKGDHDSGVCISCSKGYYYDFNDKRCKSNREDYDELKYCKYYSEKCISCEEGYLLGEDEKCVNTSNCAKSENSICTKCSEGYYLTLDYKCSNVKHCKYLNDQNICIECKENYYYNKHISKCELAEDNFENCKSTNNEGSSCDECINGFFLLKPDNLCYSNNKKGKFYKCAKSTYDGSKCGLCTEGYYLGNKDSLCTKSINCVKSENGTCIECDNHYCLNILNGTCHFNGQINEKDNKIYFHCNQTNEEGTACKICLENYTLGENGYCINNFNCEKKKNGICVECESKSPSNIYYCLNNNFGCVQNYFNSNCLRCDKDNNFDYCTECKEGYELKEGGYCSKLK